jgi:hypothetical protein
MKYLVIFIAGLLSLPVVLEAAETSSGWSEAGIRMGIQAGPKREYFHLYEVFAAYDLPWNWQSSSGWEITSKLNTSLGALHTAAETGVIGSLGTSLYVTKPGLNLIPEVGINIDLMDKRHYGKQNFGSSLLFGAYICLPYHFDCGVGIGYRLLHLSNGHIFYPPGTPNLGVDMHLISTSWHF